MSWRRVGNLTLYLQTTNYGAGENEHRFICIFINYIYTGTSITWR